MGSPQQGRTGPAGPYLKDSRTAIFTQRDCGVRPGPKLGLCRKLRVHSQKAAAEPAGSMGRPVAKRGEGRSRLLQAALDLFALHGVNGTSLQMIADSLGVTKAAVYHQFPSKAEIVLAVTAPAIEQLETVAATAERAPTAAARFEAALTGLVASALENRQFSAAMQRDPEVLRILEDRTAFRDLMTRIDTALLGQHPPREARAALALAGGGLLVSAVNPAVNELPVEDLRRVFTETMRRALEPYAATAAEDAPTSPAASLPAG